MAPFVRPRVTPPLSPQAAALDRLRRAFNAVRDAQEMLEQLARTGPAALRRTLPTPIADLEWTASALSTALLELQDPTAPAVTRAAEPVAVSQIGARRPS